MTLASATPFAIPDQLVTIDSSSTRDIDDAVWVGERAQGGFTLVVAIADPTSAVPVGGPEDIKARDLGATVYAAERAIRKMLPARISEDAGSLVAGAPARPLSSASTSTPPASRFPSRPSAARS